MNEVIFGDCRDSMRQLIADGTKVQMCVTSPPYFGLRDYGTATWEGGDGNCNHVPNVQPREKRSDSGLTGGKSTVNAGTIQRNCHCGARRIDNQIGLEATPDEYVATMTGVFKLVRDLLADDGVLWLNLGDSYNGYMANQRGTGLETKRQQSRKYIEPGAVLRYSGLKQKDLIGIPWRVAFALQADGWYLRQDIIWHKPNPMPESVTDRCTKAHEYMFLLSKNAKYYYDADAIAEIAKYPGDNRAQRSDTRKSIDPFCIDNGSRAKTGTPTSDRINRRSVWTIPSAPYKGAHFATFPPALIEPCLLAGSRTGDIVLDPFFGSGTTGEVAQRLGRKWIGCELNHDYESLQQKRTEQAALIF